MTMRPDRFFNCVFTWCLKRIQSQEDLDKWLFELEQPLPGETKKITQDDAGTDMALFEQMMAKK